jgi:hypothetical protein
MPPRKHFPGGGQPREWLPPHQRSQERERLSKQNIVPMLRLRIKTLEERNRELTELLERACVVIAGT